jgi:hypothetical protein
MRYRHRASGRTGWRRGAIVLPLALGLLVAVVACTGGGQTKGARVHNLFGDRRPTVDTDPDTRPVELGLRFRSAEPGTVTGVRFYKGARNRGGHVGSLWTSTGKLLARASFANESGSGWQSVTFAQPVPVTAGTTYVVSYHAPQGGYAADPRFFSTDTVSGPLTAPRDTATARNSVYGYGGAGTFPTQTWQAANYWVDVTLEVVDGATPAPAPTATTTAAPATTTAPTTAPTTTAPPAPTTTARPRVTTTSPPAKPAPDGGGAGLAGCPLTLAGKSCWAAHTGVPGYTKAQIVAGQTPLKRQSGTIVVSVDGTVIDGVWLDGCIAVRANNVTIKNSYIRATDPNNYNCTGGNRKASASAINNGNGEGAGQTTGLQIIDTEVDGMDIAGYSGGIGSANYSCLRCNVHGFTIQLWAGTNVTITDSFIHDNNLNHGQHHSDGIMADSGIGITMRHNWVAMDGGQTWITAAVNIGNSWNPIRDVVLERNFLAGYNGADINGSPQGSNVRVVDNALSSRNGWDSTVYLVNGLPPGSVVSGNYVPETGKPMSLR